MRRVAWIALFGALASAGCGPFRVEPVGTSAGSRHTTQTSAAPSAPAPQGRSGAPPNAAALAVAEATHEYPSAPVRETVAMATGDPASAVRAFARAYVNWSAATVAADMRALAARSIGQARSAMALAAAGTAADVDLRRAGIANAGTVEAVVAVTGDPAQFIVVTRETTTASETAAYAGVGAAWHVTVATVTRLAGGGWAVSGWQPES